MSRNTICFDTSKEDRTLLFAIVLRAKALAEKFDSPVEDPLSLHMDLTACHANGCPLKLQDLLEADDFNFVHDVFGIHRHINRSTGHLNNCFLPRFAAKVE